jgi:hypothetical protein
MRAYGIMGHESVGDLFCERGLEATTNKDCRQFLLLPRIVRSEFRVLTCKVGLFGVAGGFGYDWGGYYLSAATSAADYSATPASFYCAVHSSFFLNTHEPPGLSKNPLCSTHRR